MPINSQTMLYGLIGHPVGHSKSPQIHNPKFTFHDINAVYLAFDIHPKDLQDAVAGMWILGVQGANVTVPHKEAIIPFLSEVSEEAELIGAVNTLVRTADGFRGENTDGRGFLQSLRLEKEFDPQGKKVVILGAGGSARSIAIALALHEAETITLINRTRDKAEAISQLINTRTAGTGKHYTYNDRKEVQDALKNADLLINTTSLGMSPDIEVMPDVDLSVIGEQHLVADIIYNPEETRFLQEAKKYGARTVNGYGMLVQQASLSFAIWTGKDS